MASLAHHRRALRGVLHRKWRTELAARGTLGPQTPRDRHSALPRLGCLTRMPSRPTSAMTQTVQVANAGITRYTFESLSPGTYYFAVRAYTSVGTESDSSNIASKIVP